MPERMEHEAEEPRRQVVSFGFYKVQPEWRRLPSEARREHRREFAAVLQKWRDSEQMKVLTYSLVGLRADTDMLLWRICYSLDCLQQMQAELMGTGLGGYLTTPYSFLSMTMRSQYKIGRLDQIASERGFLHCGRHPYACILPFVKTRNWYQLPFDERQRIVAEFIRAIEEFPRVRLNTLYSFGLDDQEFVIALESDNPADFVDLAMRLRETENSAHIQRDAPVFTCVQCSANEMLERLG